jgi:hypothetical protein
MVFDEGYAMAMEACSRKDARIAVLSSQLASAEERAAKAEKEPVCADPSAPLDSCVYCKGVVHTCEKAEGPDYRCPAHPNEREDNGAWFCSETCWYEDAIAILIAQRDDLAATVAGLRGALEKVNDDLCVTSPSAIAKGVADAFTTINFALAASPAEHAARIQAAALREARNAMHRDQTWCQVADMLTDMADRLDKAAVA